MSTYKKNRPNKKKNFYAKKVFWLIIAIIALFAIGGCLAYKHYHKPASTSVTPRPTTDKIKNSNAPAAAPSDNSTNSKNNTSTPPANTPNGSVTTNLPVTKPFGAFVSNHKPGQNGSPFEEASTCSTTAGISCSITFTKNGITKSLPTKTADSAGTAYWSSWTPQSLGLTSGNWTVTAVATNGQQSESTTDSIPLQVP